MFFWGGKHMCICLSDTNHDVLDYTSSGCIFAVFSYTVDSKLLSMKNHPFLLYSYITPLEMDCSCYEHQQFKSNLTH